MKQKLMQIPIGLGGGTVTVMSGGLYCESNRTLCPNLDKYNHECRVFALKKKVYKTSPVDNFPLIRYLDKEIENRKHKRCKPCLIATGEYEAKK